MWILTLATFDEFIASLERDYGAQDKGKPFEVFCKWFLENDPEWAKTSIGKRQAGLLLGNNAIISVNDLSERL